MGLDFGIIRKRKGEAYEASGWQDVVWGRNCHMVKDIVLRNISTYDNDRHEAKLDVGTMNELLIKLAEDLKNYNLNNKEVFEDDDYVKTLFFISQLARGLADHCTDYEYLEADYEYRLIDSF